MCVCELCVCVNVKYVFYYHFNFSFGSVSKCLWHTVALGVRFHSFSQYGANNGWCRRSKSDSIGFDLFFSIVCVCVFGVHDGSGSCSNSLKSSCSGEKDELSFHSNRWCIGAHCDERHRTGLTKWYTQIHYRDLQIIEMYRIVIGSAFAKLAASDANCMQIIIIMSWNMFLIFHDVCLYSGIDCDTDCTAHVVDVEIDVYIEGLCLQLFA